MVRILTACPVLLLSAGAAKIPIEWVSIPGGRFLMGDAVAGPRHEVTVKPFEIAKTLVTVEQYRACVEAGACAEPGKGAPCNYWSSPPRPRHPVNCVDWDQARSFSSWAGGRLPTEAEWEYAARSAGKPRAYPWGDQAATCKRAVISEGGEGCGKASTWPVCSKRSGATKQGLCDMAGNLLEWVQDSYHDSYEGAPADGSAWEEPKSPVRVLRGGAWYGDAQSARAAARGRDDPGRRDVGFGFRPARGAP